MHFLVTSDEQQQVITRPILLVLVDSFLTVRGSPVSLMSALFGDISIIASRVISTMVTQ